MGYQQIWKKTLGSNELVKHEFSVGNRYRMIGLVALIVIGLLLFISSKWLGIFVIAVGAFYYGFYLKAANAYAFTDRRVLVHTGWLSTKMITTEFQKITDVTVHEPFFSRIFFKTGSLLINTAGTSSKEIVLKNVEQPYELKKKLDELRGHR